MKTKPCENTENDRLLFQCLRINTTAIERFAFIHLLPTENHIILSIRRRQSTINN